MSTINNTADQKKILLPPQNLFLSKITKAFISKKFSITTYAYGVGLSFNKKIQKINIFDTNQVIEGKIGEGGKFFTQHISIKENGIIGSCSCHLKSHCHHIAAILYEIADNPELYDKNYLKNEDSLNTQNLEDSKNLENSNNNKEITIKQSSIRSLTDDTLQWIQDFENSEEDPFLYPPNILKRLFYVLSFLPNSNNKKIQLSLKSVTLNQELSIINEDPYQINQIKNLNNRFSIPKYIKKNDLNILSTLRDIKEKIPPSVLSADSMALNAAGHLELIKELIETNRAFWENTHNDPLFLGEERQASFKWQFDSKGAQSPVFISEKPFDFLFSSSPLYYLDLKENSFGPLTTNYEKKLLDLILRCPKIIPEETAIIKQKIDPLLKKYNLPLPEKLIKKIKKTITPAPHLHLFMVDIEENKDNDFYYGYYDNDDDESLTIPAARLSFSYDKFKVNFNPEYSTDQDPCKEFSVCKEGKFFSIPRNNSLEKVFYLPLNKNHLNPISSVLGKNYTVFDDSESSILTMKKDTERYSDLFGGTSYFIDSDTFAEDTANMWLNFMKNTLPLLKQQGWQCTIDPSFEFDISYPDEEDWTFNVEESSSADWFSLQAGFSINGKSYNLIPILISVLNHHPNILEEFDENQNKDILISLEDNKKVFLPFNRIKGVLRFLKDLYKFNTTDKDGKIKLSRLEALELAELSAFTEALKMRWVGGEKLIQLGKELKNFKGIEEAPIPTSFSAELRPYQQEGVNWLQFLAKYQLAGILADDMGLGKTVQTLAHILIEKEKNPDSNPFLVIAPTSLMTNWQSEANRFAPSLKVLILHGPNRKTHFKDLCKYDLILTTYPLLVRDQEELLKHTFHTVILDEAQYIKNAKSKSAQIASQIKADHRICLTGTPLENHLGELWSLFNFLLPGYLGTTKQFYEHFRKPIEKKSSSQQQKALTRKVKPFILRRTKTEVVKELPKKTIIIQKCDLSQEQRDLYETIRVAMHKKLREEISKKGIGKSHIMILDALLKLRQICCHPQLLKIEAAKKIKKSAKLDFLLSSLEEMVEEGRRILLFSQFTTMLEMIEEECKSRNISYVKLTGQTKDRKTPIEAFQNKEVPLFLLSLKAGGTGLNLTAADTVIHYDPWWNPAAENQATDRCYRIGQDKPVFVYKLLSTGTVEEKILKMQEKKQQLADGIFDPNNKGSSALTMNDIDALFEPLIDP